MKINSSFFGNPYKMLYLCNSINDMYTRNLKLKDTEVPAKIDLETGEIVEVRNIFNSIPDGKELWLKNEKFSKMFTYSWKYLVKSLNSDELKVLVVMTLMAQPSTNSMPPLNEEVSMLQMEEYFNVSRKKLPSIFKSLFEIGVFARFEVASEDEYYKKYWILNPYISFKGRLVNSDIAKLFYGTRIEKEYAKQYQLEKTTLHVDIERKFITH